VQTPPRGSTAYASLGFTRWVSLAFVVAGITIAMVIVERTMSMQGQRGALGVMGALVGAIFVTGVVPSWLRRRARLSRLASLDLPLDRDGYLKALDGSAHRASFVVEAQTSGTADTAQLALPSGTTIAAQPGTLTITSPPLRTTRNAYAWTYYYNGGLHRWFMDVCDRVLLPLHRRQPLSSVTVRFVPEQAS